MKISARNVLKGTVNTEVTLELPGGLEIVSVITRSSAERLGLAAGKAAYAVIKSSEVLVMTD
jgi:molybdopterin-binding protein